MKIAINRLIYLSLLVFFPAMVGNTPVFSQTDATSSEINPSVPGQDALEGNPPSLEQREEALEEELNIGGKKPEFKAVPSPDEELGLDDNLPFQPTDEEVEMQQ
jgi:hypothetical protein